MLALVVDHRANLAAFSANHEDIADVERAAVDQNGRHGATALVALGLNDRTFGGAVWIGLHFHDLGLKPDFVDQGLNADLLERENLTVLNVTAPLLDPYLLLQPALTPPLRIAAFLLPLF